MRKELERPLLESRIYYEPVGLIVCRHDFTNPSSLASLVLLYWRSHFERYPISLATGGDRHFAEVALRIACLPNQRCFFLSPVFLHVLNLTMAYPKSPKSPLTRQWLALIDGDAVGDSTERRGGGGSRPRHHRHKQQSLAMTRSSSNENRSWLSFVTESPSEELEAQSHGFHRLSIPAISAPAKFYVDGGPTSSRKVRFDKHTRKRQEAPPPAPILKTSTSYGAGPGNGCISNKNVTAIQPYKKREAGQNPADAIFDLIQESFSCRTPIPSVPSSSSLFQRWEQKWERGMSLVFGVGEDDPYDGNLHSYSEDTYSDWSGERKRAEKGGQSPRSPRSPHSLNSLESCDSWDDVFLSTDGEEEANEAIPHVSSNDNQSGASSTKYKDMLRRSKMSNAISTPAVVPPPQTRLKPSAFAPFRSLRTPSPTPLVQQHAPSQSAAKVLHLSERLIQPKSTAPLKLEQNSDVQRVGALKEDKRLQMEERIRKLQSNLQHKLSEARLIPSAVHQEMTTNEDRSTKENGRPPSRGAASVSRNSTGTATRSLSSADHPPSENNYQLKMSDQSVGGALWVAAPAVSGLSDESRQRNAPLVLLDDIRTSRSCITTPGLFRRRRQNLPFSKKDADGPPSTIITTPLSHQNHPDSIPASNSEPMKKRGSQDDKESRSRHAYIAYFTRGPQVRASKSMRLYEHPSPAQFPTLDYEVVVKVQVSTVSETDGKIRRGEYWGDGTTSHPLNLPVVPGTAFYGTLVQLDHRNAAKGVGWKIGDSVISLVRVGANSRHLCIGYDRLVKVPDGVHPSLAVCLPEAYLTAFQALHIEQTRSRRYGTNSLRDKSILILGGTTKVGRALIELAVCAGSGTVYATSKSERLFSQVEDAGGIPLDKDPHHWYSLLVGKMDLVICVDCEDMQMSELKYEHIQTLTKGGRVVLLNGPEYQGEKVVDLSKVDDHSRGTSRRLYHYNVFEAWESDMKQGKRDLEHLLELLSKKAIQPKIYERIPLSKVPRAQEVVLKKALTGFIVCEPWLNDEPEERRQSGAKHRQST